MVEIGSSIFSFERNSAGFGSKYETGVVSGLRMEVAESGKVIAIGCILSSFNTATFHR